MNPNVITLRLSQEQAEGYLDLLHQQRQDQGFLEDARWLEKEMQKRGWLADEEEE